MNINYTDQTFYSENFKKKIPLLITTTFTDHPHTHSHTHKYMHAHTHLHTREHILTNKYKHKYIHTYNTRALK